MPLRKSALHDESGISLTELLIYMVLAFMVISYSMSMTSSVAKSYVRGREISKVQSNGRYAMAILARDVMNTGYKHILSDATGVTRMVQLPGTWTGTWVTGVPGSDSSASFFFSPGNPSDTLEIFKAEMATPDSLDTVLRARYFVDTSFVLWRITQNFDSTATGNWVAGDTLALSKNIEAFQCRFTIDGVNWIDNPAGNRDKIVAIQLELLMRTEREVSGSTAQNYTVGNISFTPPSADAQYLRRPYLEIVEVVNNGTLF